MAKTENIYKVAEGACFVGKGKMFAPGDEVAVDAFGKKEDFDALVAAGKIVIGVAEAK